MSAFVAAKWWKISLVYYGLMSEPGAAVYSCYIFRLRQQPGAL